MRYTLLGSSGLRVSELALGTMTFGTDWGWGADKDTSRAIFDAFVAAGGNFIDTACNYTNGTSERFVGEFIASARDQFVVATKYTLRQMAGNQHDVNNGGNSRKNMVRTVESSLRRLNTDYIDILYLHAWDFTTPVEEVLRAMDDLVRAGKVLYVGLSDTPAWVIAYAVAVAERYGWVRPVVTQLPYNLASRDPERELLPMARSLNIAVTAWGLLGGGVLTGKYNDDSDQPKRYNEASERQKNIAAELRSIADELGRSPAQVAVRWVRQQSGVIPIVGARTQAQVLDNLGVLDFTLDDAQLARLGSISEFTPGFPLSFLTSENVRNLVFGDSYDRLDNRRSVI